jgi:phosphopantothenoylcysteine decarboxylase/phosphopantothenate--cysteine ligase
LIGYFDTMVTDRKKMTVVLGVSGGIACYKAVELVRLMVQDGFAVRVIMTHGAREFVSPLTFQTLSGYPVATDTFDLTQESEIGHITGRIPPISSSLRRRRRTIGKIAAYRRRLLTTVLMATRAPVLIAPAMNIHMRKSHPPENIRSCAGWGIVC